MFARMIFKVPEKLEFLEKYFLEVYQIPDYHLEYTCGAKGDEDCPTKETPCKDCPYKTFESVRTSITAEQWIEFISLCGNKKLLRFPYKNITEMKKHVLLLVCNSSTHPDFIKVVQKFFPINVK